MIITDRRECLLLTTAAVSGVISYVPHKYNMAAAHSFRFVVIFHFFCCMIAAFVGLGKTPPEKAHVPTILTLQTENTRWGFPLSQQLS